MVIKLHAVLYINFGLSIGVRITSCVLTSTKTTNQFDPLKGLAY